MHDGEGEELADLLLGLRREQVTVSEVRFENMMPRHRDTGSSISTTDDAHGVRSILFAVVEAKFGHTKSRQWFLNFTRLRSRITFCGSDSLNKSR